MSIDRVGTAGEAWIYRVTFDDGKAHRVFVSHAMRAVMGDEQALAWCIAKMCVREGLSPHG